MDGFAGAEFERRIADAHPLTFRAGKMHFDPAALGIVEGVVLEGFKIEIRAKLAIDARQQVEIEFGRDTFGVVVSAIENVRSLGEIDAHHEDRTSAQYGPGPAQKGRRLVRLEIADGRTGKETGARPGCDLGW